MKTKTYKIFGVSLAVVLVFSLLGAFLPINQAEAQGPGTTPNQWQAVTIPGTGTGKLSPSDVTDMAVAGDGETIYIADAQLPPGAGGYAPTGMIWKSDSNAWRWDALPAPPAPFAAPPRLVAVSPDDPNAIAIVDSTPATGVFAFGIVWISNNGGTTWGALARIPGNAGSTSVVTDIAIGPARSGTILDRDYIVTVADTTVGAAAFGDVLWMGFSTVWTSALGNGAVPFPMDFTSAAVDPGFLGSRVIAVIGSGTPASEAATPSPPGADALGDTFLLLIQISDIAPLATLVRTPVVLDTATSDSPGDWDGAAGAFGIQASSIALPSDFDPTSVSSRRTWVGWTSALVGGLVTNGDDVYRVDNATVRKLQTGSANGIWSIAYNGTIAGGTLIAGENVMSGPGSFTTLVLHTEDPQLSQPSWATSAKSPTGDSLGTIPNGAAVGIDAADPMLVYAGTTGAESAISVSENGAISFNQRSLINTEIDVLEDVMPSPDGSVIFLATGDDGVANTFPFSGSSIRDSLWKSTTPTNAFSWERVRISPLEWGSAGAPPFNDLPGDSIIRLSPEWGDMPVLYWADAIGPTMGIQRSSDGGDVFSTRTAPAVIADIAVENSDILYLGDATGAANIYKSPNGAWFFNLPVPTGVVGVISDVAMAPSYPEMPVPGNILVGGTALGSVVRSPAGGAFFIPITPFIGGAAGAAQVVADTDWANNSTVYAGVAGAGLGIWRYEIGTSTVWEQIDATPAYVNPAGVAIAARMITGLATVGTGSSVLYGSWFDGAVNSGATRSLVPDVPLIASWNWDQMDVGSVAGPAFTVLPNALRASKGGSVSLWAIDTAAVALMAYHDTMADVRVDLEVPDEIKPSLAEMTRGWNSPFTISWNLISNATDYELQVATDPAITQVVFTSLPFGPAGPPWYVAPQPLQPAIVVPAGTLVAGADYFVRARIRDQIPNDAIRTPWSSVVRITVLAGQVVEVTYLGPQPLGPVPGATGVPRASTGFSFAPYAQATRYEYTLARDAGLTDVLAAGKTSNTAFQYDGTLDWNTTYFWAVRAVEPTISDWSPVSNFTTEQEPVPTIIIEPAPPPPPAPVIPPSPLTPAVIWVIIAIGAILVIAVIVLILRTRRIT